MTAATSPDPSRSARAAVAFTAAGVVAFAELYGVQALLPSLGRDAGIAPADAALVLSAGAMGLAAAVVPWSLAARRFGAGPMLRVALAASVLLGPLVPALMTMGELVIARFVQGALIAGIPALALTHLGEVLDRRSAAIIAGWYVAGTSLGGLLGRLAAGAAGEFLGWRGGLISASLLGLVAAVVFFLAVPHGHVGSGSAQELKAGQTLKDRRVWMLCGMALVLMGAFVALYNYFGFRLVGTDFGLPDIAVSLIFLAYLFGTASAALSGRATARFGRSAVLAFGIAAQLAGSALTVSSLLPLAVGGLVVATAGFFAAHAVAAGWVAELGRGSAAPSAAYTLAYYIGAGLLGWLGGFVYAGGGWWATVAAICLAVLAALGMLLLVPRGGKPGH